MEIEKVRRTERGWAGHYVCAASCLFRRNTLLEFNDVKIVVSTVGAKRDPITGFCEKIADNRYFETMVFYAKRVKDKYWDADISRQITTYGEWFITDLDDIAANDMHENIVNEMILRLVNHAWNY